MAIYSVNQNKQFYVVSSVVVTEPSSEGQLKIVKVPSDNPTQVCFKHYGKGGLTRTDLIDLDKVCYVKKTAKADMQRKLKKATITLDENYLVDSNPIVGQDYVLRVQINNYLAPGDACVLVKSGAVHAFKGMTAEQFYTKMADVLTKTFSRDPQKLLTFEGSADGLVITEVGDQPWRLGVLSQDAVNFEVQPTTVKYGGDDVIWGKVEYADTDTTVGNGKQIADMEYFCQAERGDMSRNMGWPNNIDVKYMVDPTQEYDVLDVHYHYSGEGVQVHKSEKDLVFVSTTSSVLDAILAALKPTTTNSSAGA